MKMMKLYLYMAMLSVGVSSAMAQLVWTGTVGNVIWDTSSANWSNGTASAVYHDGSNVVFNDAAVQTNINIALAVSPASVVISNGAKYFVFTNNVITGNGGITKAGSGTAQFGGVAANTAYANSFTFTGGAFVGQGSLLYFAGNTSDTAKAQGGVAYGFGTGAITLGATNAVFRFSGYSNSSQITNALEVTGGGSLDLSRYNNTTSNQNNFAGNIAIRSTNLFIITSTNA